MVGVGPGLLSVMWTAAPSPVQPNLISSPQATPSLGPRSARSAGHFKDVCRENTVRLSFSSLSLTTQMAAVVPTRVAPSPPAGKRSAQPGALQVSSDPVYLDMVRGPPGRGPVPPLQCPLLQTPVTSLEPPEISADQLPGGCPGPPPWLWLICQSSSQGSTVPTSAGLFPRLFYRTQKQPDEGTTG